MKVICNQAKVCRMRKDCFHSKPHSPVYYDVGRTNCMGALCTVSKDMLGNLIEGKCIPVKRQILIFNKEDEK